MDGSKEKRRYAVRVGDLTTGGALHARSTIGVIVSFPDKDFERALSIDEAREFLVQIAAQVDRAEMLAS